MPRAVAWWVLVGVVALPCAEARAEGPVSVERFSFLDAPPPAPPPMPPAPEREASEWARKSWEVSPHLGWTSAACRSADAGTGACDGMGTGTAIGAGALYRITPYVALGAELEAIDFAFDPSASTPGASAGSSRGYFFGPVFRGYFAERGSVDPWIEIGFGGGTIATSYELGGARHSATEQGAATSVGAGIDFWVSPWLKLGPALSERVVLPTEVKTCRDGACSSRTVSDAGGVTRTTRLGVEVTIAFGREM
jgi:hypothetical protein